MSQPLGLRHGPHPGTGAVQVLVSAVLAALLVGAAATETLGAGTDALTVTGDLLVGVVWIGVAASLWPQERTRRAAAISAGFAAAWLAGSIEPALVLLHRGPLMHLVLAYPSGRLDSGVARLVVGAAYLQGALRRGARRSRVDAGVRDGAGCRHLIPRRSSRPVPSGAADSCRWRSLWVPAR